MPSHIGIRANEDPLCSGLTGRYGRLRGGESNQPRHLAVRAIRKRQAEACLCAHRRSRRWSGKRCALPRAELSITIQIEKGDPAAAFELDDTSMRRPPRVVRQLAFSREGADDIFWLQTKPSYFVRAGGVPGPRSPVVALHRELIVQGPAK